MSNIYVIMFIMSEFDTLSSLVEAGELKIINMIGIPRSVSTALGRALNETPDDSIFVNEPFNRTNRSLEVSCGQILESVRPKLDHIDRPLTLITKNMATYIDTQYFVRLNDISSHTIFSVRNPLIQIGSLVTRIANDLSIETGADIISQDRVYPYLPAVVKFLIDSDLSTNFSRTGWGPIFEHYNRLPPSQSTVVDGDSLTADPTTILLELARDTEVTYSEQMVDGWGARYVNANTGSSRFNDENNGWTNVAARSTGFTSATREPIQIDQVPDELRTHIIEVAFPVYQNMTAK